MFLRTLVISSKPWVVKSCSASAWERLAVVAKESANETADQTGNRAAVIDFARHQTECQQFATVVGDEVELEPIELAHRSLAPASTDGKDAMLRDEGVVADGEASGGDKADAGASSQLGLQVDDQRQQARGINATKREKLTRWGTSARSWVWTCRV